MSSTSLATYEGGPAATFDVTLLTTPLAPVELELRSEDPSEGLVVAPGYSFPAVAQVFVFTPEDWSVPRRVVVQPVEDHLDDGDARYAVVLRVAYSEDAVYAGAPARSVGVTNADHEP